MTSDIVLRTLRGTGEPFTTQGGMLGDVIAACAEAGVRHEPVNYYASIAPAGGTKMFHESYHDGWQKAITADASGHPTLWAAYSLGAYIVGDLLAAHELHNCIGVILISDPVRHRRQITNGGVNPTFFGCAGERWIPQSNYPVYSFSAPNDPISSLSAANPFRFAAEIVTGHAQGINLQRASGFADVPALVDAISRYLGTPPLGPNPAKPSRHVIYSTEKMPGSNTTYTKSAADKARLIIREFNAKRGN